MSLFDRLTYALIAAFFGALLGCAGWWLYGMAHSLNYSGRPMDPVFRHWVIGSAGAFAVPGFVVGARAADVVGDAFSAIFHFELNQAPGQAAGLAAGLIFLVLVGVALWFTTPGR